MASLVDGGARVLNVNGEGNKMRIYAILYLYRYNNIIIWWENKRGEKTNIYRDGNGDVGQDGEVNGSVVSIES